MLNRIVLIGRLTRDPELRFTPNGRAVCSFTLAVDRPFTNQEGNREADFINIVVWNKPAENCAQYLGKGKLAAVDGRLQIRSYDGNDGQRRWVTEVIAEQVRFLSPKGEGSGDNSPSSARSQGKQPGEWQADDAPWAEDTGYQSDDLPF